MMYLHIFSLRCWYAAGKGFLFVLLFLTIVRITFLLGRLVGVKLEAGSRVRAVSRVCQITWQITLGYSLCGIVSRAGGVESSIIDCKARKVKCAD